MWNTRWWLALPLVLAAAAPARASAVRDGAELFAPEAARAAETRLE
jgi:hypothetical protein